MKRLLSILLLTLYTIATSGAIVQMHYCGENLASWTVSMETPSTTSCCGKTSENSCHTTQKTCCKDDAITLKIKQDHKLPYFGFKIQEQTWVAILPERMYFTLPSVALTDRADFLFPYANAPPGRWQYIPLYTLHQSWKLYDVVA